MRFSVSSPLSNCVPTIASMLMNRPTSFVTKFARPSIAHVIRVPAPSGTSVNDAVLEARLAEYCALLAERAPIASRLTKRGIARATAIDLDDQLRYELANIRRAFATEDAKEARQAFLEKRAPVFKGR